MQAVEISPDDVLVAIDRNEVFAHFAPEAAVSQIDETKTGSLTASVMKKSDSDLIVRIGGFLGKLDKNGVARHPANL